MSEKLALINVFERPAAQTEKVQQEQQQSVIDEDVDMMDVDDPSQGQLQGELQQQVDGLIGQEQGPEGEVLNFTELIQDLRSVYPEQQMKDISTSYCFICLLHLANEKGLVLEGDLEGERAMQEIRVSRDGTVGEGYEGE